MHKRSRRWATRRAIPAAAAAVMLAAAGTAAAVAAPGGGGGLGWRGIVHRNSPTVQPQLNMPFELERKSPRSASEGAPEEQLSPRISQADTPLRRGNSGKQGVLCCVARPAPKV